MYTHSHLWITFVEMMVSEKDGTACGENPSSIVEICAKGDVILLIGTEQKKIRSLSSILRNLSNDFDKLIVRNFAEDQILWCRDTHKVHMPDDSAMAGEIIRSIIHLRNDVVPLHLASQDVYDIAITADKFDCTLVVKQASTLWLDQRNVTDIRSLSRLMTAAYILRNPEAFSNKIFAMIMQHQGLMSITS